MVICSGVCALGLAWAQQDEKLTITTYYPSPTGVYQTLRIAPGGNPADCNDPITAPLGKMYFDSTENSLYICSAQGATAGYQLVPGGNGAWAVNSNKLYVLNTTLNVGIGTTNPESALVVAGNSTGIPSVNSIHMGIETGANNGWAAIDLAGNITNGSHIDFTAPGTSYKGRIIYDNPSNTFGFWTNSGPMTNAKMVIDADGHVGIGTMTPTAQLEVAKTGGDAMFRVMQSGGSNGYITSQATRTVIGTAGATDLQFRTDNTDRLFINSTTGNVGIGTTTPTARLHVVGNSLTSAVIAAQGDYYRNDWPSGWGGGLVTWDISCSSVYYTGLMQRSDKRLKKDIVQLETSAVDNLLKLRPVVYRWKDTAWQGDKIHYGFIAQDVEEVFPELVLESSDDQKMKSIATDELIAVLTKAIQVLKKDNEELKARVTALEK